MSGTINTIPASAIVSVTPGVISAGGSALQLIGLMLTNNTFVPYGQVLSFPSALSLSNYFGPNSNEYADGVVYFNGFANSNKLPGALLVAQYPVVNVPAYLRGGLPASITTLQTIGTSGHLNVTIDSVTQSASFSLSGITSYSQAAQIIDGAFNITGPVQVTGTGAIGATFTGTGSGSTIVASVVTGLISVGDTLSGTGVTAGTTVTAYGAGAVGQAGTYVLSTTCTASAAAITCSSNVLNLTVATGNVQIGQQFQVPGTYINAFGTGTGGVGTYVLSGVASRVASGAVSLSRPVVTYVTQNGGAFQIKSTTAGASSAITYASGSDAPLLGLTAATGAVLSQGAVPAVPATFMNSVIVQTTNWATFWTLFDPDSGSGNTQKQAFASWVNSQNDQFAYIAWDPDITPTLSNAATSSLGYILTQNQSNGTIPIYETAEISSGLAAMIAGWAASLDFTETNGRANMAFRSQGGINPTVTNQTVAQNLIANGYNFYGAYATRSQTWQFLYPGSITGPFQWADSYVCQIQLNASFQQALIALFTQIYSVPYNPPGYGLIRSGLMGPINAAINFGTIRQNVPLSTAQAAEVNNAAGLKIDTILSTQGWYVQILPAAPQTRQNRQSPPITVWYMDGQSVQQINLASILVQ